MDAEELVVKKTKKWVIASLGITGFLTVGIFLMIVLIGSIAVQEGQRAVVEMVSRNTQTDDTSFQSEVLRWRPEIEYWASHYGIEDWVPELLAIMQVESRGQVADLMQSSESAGLPPNTLQYEDSIAQGVRYLASIIARAEANGLGDDRMAIKQAYNFGVAYINWLARNGYTHNLDVAAIYSRTVVAPSLGNTTGQTYSYVNTVSTANGRPYLYHNGGNFHYAYLVRHVMFLMQVNGAQVVDGIVLPIDPPFVVTSGFGPRWGSHHAGIDLCGGFGAPVRSILDGRVTRVVNHFASNDGWLGHPGGFGNVVFIEHEGGIVTVYAHLMSNVTVHMGERVNAGQVIGFQGNSGNSSGTHLHFEWRENSIAVDPESRINFRIEGGN